MCASVFRMFIFSFVLNLPHKSSYMFLKIDLKFYRLGSNDMKICICFLIFDSAIFDGGMTLADSKNSLRNSRHLFDWIALKLCKMPRRNLKVRMELWILMLTFSTLLPFVTFGIFQTFRPFDREGRFFICYWNLIY